MTSPYLAMDLDKIEHNARSITALCAHYGIEVQGVTKGVCGHPEVARAMLRGGVASIADSRLRNIRRLHAAGIDRASTLLRIPPLSGVNDVVAAVDVSLNSELGVLAGLAAAASAGGRVHEVVIMVELGDLREGVMCDDMIPFVREAVRLGGIRIKGIGANLACFGGVVPDVDNMTWLATLADKTQAACGYELDWVSGINSSGLDLIASGQMPSRINHARIGEAILLGRETIARRPWPGTFQDAFVLHAEVLECKRKPSLPCGKRGEDAFGKHEAFADRGTITRALLNVGREDVNVDGIVPLDAGIVVLGASSGYLVVEVTEAVERPAVGDELRFSLDYGALLAASTSDYVKKRPLKNGVPLEAAS